MLTTVTITAASRLLIELTRLNAASAAVMVPLSTVTMTKRDTVLRAHISDSQQAVQKNLMTYFFAPNKSCFNHVTSCMSIKM